MNAINKENLKYCLKINKDLINGRIKNRPRVCATSAKAGEGRYYSEYSRTPYSKNFHYALRIAYSHLGNALCSNALGACAEQHAANIVLHKRNCQINQLVFSKALETRTTKRIAYCANCKALFCI